MKYLQPDFQEKVLTDHPGEDMFKIKVILAFSPLWFIYNLFASKALPLQTKTIILGQHTDLVDNLQHANNGSPDQAAATVIVCTKKL